MRFLTENKRGGAGAGGGRHGKPMRAVEPVEPLPPRRPRPIPPGHAFKADLDLAELDERRRPGMTWPGKSYEISKNHIAFRSRRMCYLGRSLLALVHLVDDTPVPLFGEVIASEYDGDGLYRTVIGLMELPDEEPIKTWIAGQAGRGS